ncbi:MAG TPA: phosphate ABC transporter permease subunit PstC [Candidatus Nanopelagicales bacterium]
MAETAPSTSPISGASVRRGDRIFSGLSKGAGTLVLVIMAAIAAFLIWRSIPSLTSNTVNFFTYEGWAPDANPPAFGIAALAFGTLVASFIAMVLAVPVGIGIALFISLYAGRRLASSLAFVTDLLAAVPSIIFGLWGLQVLLPGSQGLQVWMNDYLSWTVVFRNTLDLYGKSLFLASLVLAIMILPTVAAVSREVIVQVPAGHKEAALALGATRWEMVKMAVFPFAKPGMISAAMLGLGRALGETIAVALILSAAFTINLHLTEPGGNTFAANIALKWNEAGGNGLSALVASGLVLFFLTLTVNMIARWIIARRAEFSGAN